MVFLAADARFGERLPAIRAFPQLFRPSDFVPPTEQIGSAVVQVVHSCPPAHATKPQKIAATAIPAESARAITTTHSSGENHTQAHKAHTDPIKTNKSFI